MTEQTQPEALRVADKLNSLCVAEFAWKTLNHAAILLRRHHALNRELANQLSGAKDRIAELEAQLAQRERPALTDEQIREALIETDGLLRRRLGLPLNEPEHIGLGINPVFIIEFAHAIERAHGIGDPT